MAIDPFPTFQKYIAIKLTFDTSNNYNFFTYSGKTSQSKSSFLKRRDRFHFYALTKELQNDLGEIENYLFVNLVHSPDLWIGDLLDDTCRDRYREFLKYQNSFLYMFREESQRLKTYLDETDTSFNRLLTVKQGIPRLMELVYAEQFTPMLLHGFNRVFAILDTWKKHRNVFEPILWEPVQRQILFQDFIQRYSHRLTTDALRSTLRETFIQEE